MQLSVLFYEENPKNMILEFSFSNFGPIKDLVTLSFEPTNDDRLKDYYICEQEYGQKVLKMGVIYGPNASGKSTILKALELLRDLIISPLDQKNDKIKYNKFLLSKESLEKPTEFFLTFFVDKIKYKYYLSLDKNSIREEKLTFYPHNRPAEVFSRETIMGESVVELGSTINYTKKDQIILKGNTLPNNTVLGSYSKSNITIKPLEKVFDWFSISLAPLISPKHSLFEYTSEAIESGTIKKEEVLNLLQSADLNITDLEIIDEEIEINETMKKVFNALDLPDNIKEDVNNNKLTEVNVLFKHEVKKENDDTLVMQIDKEWESSGTLRYYGLSGAMLRAKEFNKILFIDEFDASLHSDLLKQIVLTFLSKSTNSQLIFTTHNLAFLNERDIFRNDVIWFTEKNSSGAVSLFSLADFKSSQLRKESSIFNAYMLGKIGAKPNVTGSYFKIEE